MYLIVTINESFVHHLQDCKIIRQTRKGSMDTLKAIYQPGRLEIVQEEVDLQKTKNDLDFIVLKFYYDDYNVRNADRSFKKYTYQLRLPGEALYNEFNIVEIYNLDGKYYRLNFAHAKQDKYVFNYRYPGGARLAKRRKI
jgi:hypothetical protein